MVRHEVPWCLVMLLYCCPDYATATINCFSSQHATIEKHLCGADARHEYTDAVQGFSRLQMLPKIIPPH